PVWPFGIATQQSKARRNRALRFVRRGGILLQRGKAICVAFPPPSLGVSSLDLGRLHPRAAPFSSVFLSAIEENGRGPSVRGRQASAGHACAGMLLCGISRVRSSAEAEAARGDHSAAARYGRSSSIGKAASRSARVIRSAATCRK